MILYYRTLPKTVGAVRHKDENAYRGMQDSRIEFLKPLCLRVQRFF